MPPDEAICDQPQHQEVEEVERPDQRWIGLQELPRETLGSIEHNQRMESVRLRPPGRRCILRTNAPAHRQRRRACSCALKVLTFLTGSDCLLS